MTASLSTMSIDYYLQTAAADGAGPDLTSYYVSAKTPAGRWFGAGLEQMNIDVEVPVDRDSALSLFRDHVDPGTGTRLGRPVMGKTAAPVGAKTPVGAEAKAERQGVHGFDMTFSPPKSVSTLWAMAEPQIQGAVYAAHQQAVEEALRWAEENVIQTRSGRGGGAHVAINGISASLFDHWDSRNGDPQLHTHAVIVNKVQRASDGEWLTIDSFPLHRHMVAISEKYDSLLMDRIHQHLGAVPETRDANARAAIESIMAARETDDQQIIKSPDTSTSHRVELSGIPEALIDEFSTRARIINALTDERVADYEGRYGKRPSNAEILKFRTEATLASRKPKDKESTETLPEKMQGWRRRALAAGYNPDDVVRASVGHPQNTITPDMITDEVVDSIGSWTLNEASMRRTSFRRANLIASAERVTRLVRCESAEERHQLVSRVVEDALSKAVALTPDRDFPRFDAPEHDDPTVLNRGESVFDHRRMAGVYTTTQIMDEEEFLISRTQNDSSPAITDTEQLEEELSEWRSDSGVPLSEDKRQAASEVLSSTAGMSAMIGPAGTGKTTSMAAITQIWQREYGDGSVVGLAPSAVAAGVLADEIGVSTENTAKWLYESVGSGAAARAERAHRNEAQLAALMKEDAQAPKSDASRLRKINQLRAKLAEDHAAQAKYQLRQNQLLMIDEASMVSTPQLAELASQAEQAGAKVLLVGDPAQLEAVDAGGFLGHMDRNAEVSRLTQVFRFSNDWEKEASLGLRSGDTEVLKSYNEHGRIHGDPDTDASESAYARWKEDRDEFAASNQANPEGKQKSTILIASDNATVDDLNAKAHADMVASGEVDIEHTVEVRGEHQAGVGETVLARKNDRSLRDSEGQFVSNGTLLTLTGVRPDGSAEAVVNSTGASLTLDKSYLADSVELGYAVTAHRAQGLTVTSAHAVVSPGLSRELFYVAMTRGKESNDAYVQLGTEEEMPIASWKGAHAGVVAAHETAATDDPVVALEGVLGRSQAEKSAHEIQDAEHGWAHDLGRMVHERSYLTWAARTTRTQQWVAKYFPPEQVELITSDADWHRMVSADPALNHHGGVTGDETASRIIAGCEKPDEHGVGPGGMLHDLIPETEAQSGMLTAVDAQIQEQLAIRAAEARMEQPEWFSELASKYPEGHVPQKDLDAVLIWRAASNQVEADTAVGKEPPQRDHLRPFWDRMEKTLSRSAAATREEIELPEVPMPEPLPTAEYQLNHHELDALVEDWDQLLAQEENQIPASFIEDTEPDIDDPAQWAATQATTRSEAPDAGVER